MAFNLKTWIDRVSEFPNRRRLDSTGITDTYEVTRAEGNVSAEGDKIDAANMNDLEGRVKDAIDPIEETANAAVQTIKINGTEQTKTDGTVNLPAFPTQLPASGITVGTFAGAVVANAAAVATLTTKQVRNLTQSTASPTGGVSGDTWHMYTA